MYLGALSLRLDFLHYEEACIQKSFNTVDQATLFTPREPRRRCTSDASVAKKKKCNGYIGTNKVELGKKLERTCPSTY
jgi:hypothetical protein